MSELTGRVNLPDWREGTRLICRRERPHPGAQLTFTDLDGHRFQCFITDQTDEDVAALEVLHRQHAQVEDHVKTLKASAPATCRSTPSRRTPPGSSSHRSCTTSWHWTQLLCLDGEHQNCEPKRLRYPILHVARQLTRPPPPRHPTPPRRLALGRRDPARLQTAAITPRTGLTQPGTNDAQDERARVDRRCPNPATATP